MKTLSADKVVLIHESTPRRLIVIWNRSGLSDSRHSLDATTPLPHNRRMTPTLSIVALERVEPEQNVFRYYVLSVEPTLFDDVSLVREWGRIGTRGRRIVQFCPDAATTRVELGVWLARKRRRGYSEPGQGPSPGDRQVTRRAAFPLARSASL